MKNTMATRGLPRLALVGAIGAVLTGCGGSSGDDNGDGGFGVNSVGDIEEGVITGSRDVNGDGIIDISFGDIDGDGYEDFDIDGDGVFDTKLGDVTFNDRTDFDVNNDGYADYDVNGNGSVDRSVVDDDGFIVGYDSTGDGQADLDVDGEAIGPVFTPVSAQNPCGSASGSDNDSSNDDWSDNCTVSRANQFSRSLYTAGIQRIVWCAGFDGGSGAGTVDEFTDGAFGNQTQAAVEAYQSANSLTPDGVVGRDTWGVMRESLGESLEVVEGGGLEPYGVTGRCDDLKLFLADTAFADSEVVINGWQLTKGATDSTPVPFSVESQPVD